MHCTCFVLGFDPCGMVIGYPILSEAMSNPYIIQTKNDFEPISIILFIQFKIERGQSQKSSICN